MEVDPGEDGPDQAPLNKLAVSGDQLVDSVTGAPVTLQGVAFASGVWQWLFSDRQAGALDSVQYMQNESDFAQVHDWGANAVTLYLNWYWFYDDTGVPQEAGWQWLTKTLDWCARHRLYVVPSLVVYPVGGWRGGSTFWANTEARDELQAFWVEFATRFQGRPEVVGVDVLNEPQGAPHGNSDYAAYQLDIIHAVRSVDPNLIVFIEGEWGSLQRVLLQEPNLVYVIHYYEPYYFSAEGYPWISSGDVAVGSHYPGEMVMGTTWVADLLPQTVLSNSDARMTSWVTIDSGPLLVPAGSPAEAAEPAFHLVNGGAGSELDLDDVEYRILRNGQTAWSDWALVLNGDFESPGASDDAIHWITNPSTGQNGVILDRKQVTPSDAPSGSGSWVWEMASCEDCWIGLADWWVGTLGEIPVFPGDQIELRFAARWRGMSGATLSAGMHLMKYTKEYWDSTALRAAVKRDIVDFSTGNQVPVLVGEFTPSLVSPRPDAITYASDLMDAFQEAGLSWTFYDYRENWSAARPYLGLYNCPVGKPNGDPTCVEATDVRDVLIAHLEK